VDVLGALDSWSLVLKWTALYVEDSICWIIVQMGIASILISSAVAHGVSLFGAGIFAHTFNDTRQYIRF
jgi:hypothetical protein